MIYFQLETTEPHTTMPLEINIKKNPGTLEAGAVKFLFIQSRFATVKCAGLKQKSWFPVTSLSSMLATRCLRICGLLRLCG